MADDGYTILHRKDERGVIVESKVFGPDDEVPKGFGPAEYQSVYAPREDDQEPVAESVLTPWESPIATGTWVENRPEGAEVDEGTPMEVRAPDDLTDAEREALEAAVRQSTDDLIARTEELDGGSPREAREQSEDGDLTDAEAPPQGGPGSGRDVWLGYADSKGVSVPEGATRDEIIAACEKAGVPVD